MTKPRIKNLTILILLNLMREVDVKMNCYKKSYTAFLRNVINEKEPSFSDALSSNSPRKKSNEITLV